TTNYRHTISANGNTIALLTRNSSGDTLRYMLEDQQGSVSSITSSTGTNIVSENFDAFGNRRDATDWSGPPSTTDRNTMDGITRQGYTYQTVLGSMGLNHMNGRVQDAITGRFISADPYITEPTNTQNYNRYSYVYNNPMSNVDPSGFNTNTYDAGGGCTATVDYTIFISGSMRLNGPYGSG